MIQTKQEVVYGDRDEKQGKIKVEIQSTKTVKSGIFFLVNDWDISKNPPEIWKAKEVFYSNAQIDQIDAYIEANHDLSELTKSQKEWQKLKIGLMIDTQTNLFPSGNTIYKLTPSDWEFSPEEDETEPFTMP